MEQQLRHAGNEYAPGQRHDRLVEVRRHEQGRADHAQVEQHRRERGNGKATVAIQDRAAQRRQGNQEQVGKGDAQHIGGQRELFRLPMKAGGEQRDQHRRTSHPQQRDARQRQPQGAGHAVDQILHLGQGEPGAVLRQYRYERLGKGPFGEQPTQEIGDLEGDEEGIRLGLRTEIGRHHHVPHHAQHTGQHGHDADHHARAQQTGCLIGGWSRRSCIGHVSRQ